MRLVCVGDSFTEGLCDDLRPDGEYLGWADRLATAVAPVDYANLAVRGKLFDQILSEQVPVAKSLGYDVVTFHAGGNDVLRRGTDLDDLFSRYDTAVADLARHGQVLAFTCLTRAGGTGRLADLLAQRFGAFNANVREVAARHGAVVVDLELIDALSDRRFWHSDRLHLNPEGHKRVTAAVLEALGHDTGNWWLEPLPAHSRNRAQNVGADLTWVYGHFLPWLWRRARGVSSGDGRVAKDTSLRTVRS
jgi:lysophospholipase L1-like esterase